MHFQLCNIKRAATSGGRENMAKWKCAIWHSGALNTHGMLSFQFVCYFGSHFSLFHVEASPSLENCTEFSRFLFNLNFVFVSYNSATQFTFYENAENAEHPLWCFWLLIIFQLILYNYIFHPIQWSNVWSFVMSYDLCSNSTEFFSGIIRTLVVHTKYKVLQT